MNYLPRSRPSLSLCLLLGAVGTSAALGHQPRKVPALKLLPLLSAKPLKEDPGDDELRKRLKARYNAAVGEVKWWYEADHMSGHYAITRLYLPDHFFDPWHRLVRAGLEVFDTPAEKVFLLSQYLEAAKEHEKFLEERYDAGRITIEWVHRARAERLNAEIQLLWAKRQAGKRLEDRR